jgi:CheY-like chemotaxis protein
VKTPIVALTADAFEDDRRACLSAGMDDFLVKPLTPDTLRAALLRWTSPVQAVKVAV